MSLAAASAVVAPVVAQSVNPLEMTLVAFNTNPYFIGITMLLLNLGGRFLAMEVTKEQEKFFQHTWVRAILIFVVIFVATRNVVIAFWLSVIVITLLRFLLNENSSLYLLKKETPLTREKFQGASANVLTPEEADIYRKLTDKLAKTRPQAQVNTTQDEKSYSVLQTYTTNMSLLQL
jgi:hypothetical protein